MASTPELGWQVLLDENEWEWEEALQIPPSDSSVPSREGAGRWRGWTVAGIALCLALAVGLPLWRQAETGLVVVEKSLSHTVALESQAQETGDALLVEALIDPQTEMDWRARIETGLRQEAGETEILDFSLHDDRAVARIRVAYPQNGGVYRESRFYRETAGGWLRTEPDARLWGSSESIESEFFVFHFRQLDRTAVRDAAPLLDAVYLHIHTALEVPLRATSDPADKIQIHVASAKEAAVYRLYDRGKPLWVDSPWLLRLPDSVADGQALVEMVAFSLRRSAVNELLSPLSETDEPTAALLGGLRLWLAWEKTTLTQSHKIGVVGWLYEYAPHSPQALLNAFPEICELFDMWHIVPPAGPAFFYCTVKPTFLRSTYSRSPASLAQLPISQPQYLSSVDGSGGLQGESGVYTQGQVIAFATIMEYAAHTYGPGSVAALLRAAREGKNWTTAAPESVGLSAAEFEMGWWAWLANEYGVTGGG